MCEWCVEVAGFCCYSLSFLFCSSFFDLPHEVDSVGDDDEDDAHVFCEGEEEVAEVFGLDGWVLVVEFVDFDESLYDVLYVGAEGVGYGLQGQCAVCYAVLEEYADDGCSVESDFLYADDGCLQVEEYGVEVECSSLECLLLYGLLLYLLYALEVFGCDGFGCELL